jgi:hypothetical protein
MIDSNFDIHNLDSVREAYDPKLVKKALKITTNKLAAKSKTAISKKVRARYKVSVSDFNQRSQVSKVSNSTDSYSSAFIWRGKKIGLFNFGAHEIKKLAGGSAQRTQYKTRKNKKNNGRRETKSTSRALKASGRTAYGISVMVKAGQRKTIGADDGILPFISIGRNNQLHIFRRVGSDRKKLHRLDTLSIPQMINAVGGAEITSEVVGAELAIEFDRAMKFVTKGRQ